VCLGLLDNLISIIIGFVTTLLFYGDGVVSPMPQPSSWRTRVSLFVWVITFDLSGMGDPASSYATAGIALRIIWPRKLHHYVKVEIPSVGSFLIINILSYLHISRRSGSYTNSNFERPTRCNFSPIKTQTRWHPILGFCFWRFRIRRIWKRIFRYRLSPETFGYTLVPPLPPLMEIDYSESGFSYFFSVSSGRRRDSSSK
jgi:hypothetical protein